jgi:ubiquinone/menaquinone biosynthesis C-methylase UbiE
VVTGRVNYEEIAPTYNRRYIANPLPQVAATLRALVEDLDPARILEVGCGTGRWLAELGQAGRNVSGLDLSPAMLSQARTQLEPVKPGPANLACGHALRLPFPNRTFDLVYCVNALHHFGGPRAFVAEAGRLLRPGGALAVVGMDPRRSRDTWYLYRYFKGTYAADRRRFPTPGELVDWMAVQGFERIEWRPAERIFGPLVGRDIFKNSFLHKGGTSQLALLSDEAYALGIRHIEATLVQAEAAGKTLVFPVDILLTITVGRLADTDSPRRVAQRRARVSY